MRRTIYPRFHTALAMAGLLLVVVWLYAPTLGFGFFWDDPLWFGRIVGKSFGELIEPAAEYHFYRPGVMLYHRLFLKPDDTFAVPLLHVAHIGWHLLNISLVYALTRRLGLESWRAAVVAVLTAVYPFSYQAVAWTAAQQPMAVALQNGAWLTFLQASRGRTHRRLAAAVSVLLFLIALTVQEGTVAVSLVPFLVELVLCGRNLGNVNWKLAAVYPLLGLGFGLLWLQVPRLPGYTTLAFEGQTVLYLLQGVVFPVLGRPGGYEPGQTLATGTLVAAMGLMLGALLVAAWLAGRGRLALFGLAWALLGVAPAIVGLRYESFVSLSPRLLYYCGPGVALLWTCAVLPSRPDRRVWRMVGVALVGLIILQSGLLLLSFQQMYAVGTLHLKELIQMAQTGSTRLMFVNFPDRYAPKRSPYPLGYWGMTLAPVVVDLADFPAVVTGQRPQTESRSLPWIDAEARDVSPYYTDLRGVITPPDQLYQLARKMDAVYLSRYFADGSLALRWAGAVTAGPSVASCQAVFGGRLCLQAAEANAQPGRLSLTLTWQSLAVAQPHDTIFVHVGQVGQPPVTQADGDLWMGMLPLYVLPPGDTIREQRIILLPQSLPSGRLAIQVGIYDRVTGERLPATTPQGEPLPGNAFVVGYLP